MSNNPAIVIGVNAVGNANQVLQTVDQKLQQTATTVDSTSNKIVSRTSQMAAAFKQNLSSIAQSVAGLGAGITSFAFSFGSVEKAQLSAASAQLQYERSLDRLNKLQASGKATAEQLALAQQEVALNSSKLAEAQDNAREAYIQFLAQIPSQIISFGVGTISMLKLMGVTLETNRIRMFLFGTTSTVSLGAVQTATIRTSGAFATMGATMKAALISNPIGIALLGLTTLITLVATNTFGLRDAFFELGKMITNFLDIHFRPLADGLRWFYNNVLKPLGVAFGIETPPEIAKAEESLGSFKDTTDIANTAIKQFATDTTSAFKQISTDISETVNKAINDFKSFAQAREQYFRPQEVIDLAAGITSNLPATAGRGLLRTDVGTGRNVHPVDPSTLRSGRVVALTNFANPAGGKQLTAIANAHGGDYFVNRPTLFLAGEAGIERATFTPMSGGGGRGETHIHLHIGSKEIAHAIFDDIYSMVNRRHTRHMRITHEAIHGTG